MRAMLVNEFGGPEVLKLADAPEPVPGPYDLLIEVHAAATNPVDFKIRKGAFRAARTLPLIPGFDVSGVVRGLGAKAEGFNVGDEIYASPSLVRDGSNAELVCVDARTVALKPKSLDHLNAAALPLAILTAWEALYERTALNAGETVLIQGGGGGVGHLAIQLARLHGCRVLTTASRAESIELCRSLGADVVINHQKEDVLERVKSETGGRGCEVVFDCVGGPIFDYSCRCVAVNGRMCTIVGANSVESLRDLFVRNGTLHFEFMGAPTMHGVRPEKQGDILRRTAWLVDNGRLGVHVSRTFDLKDLAEAHKLQESGHATGKLAIRVR